MGVKVHTFCKTIESLSLIIRALNRQLFRLNFNQKLNDLKAGFCKHVALLSVPQVFSI